LASGYADRPLHLIGPALFPDYIRLLKLLYAIVLPLVFAAALLAQLLAQSGNFGGAFGAAIAVAIQTAVHFGFWPAVIFAIRERQPQHKVNLWNPEMLPQLPATGAIKLSDTVASVVWFALVLGA